MMTYVLLVLGFVLLIKGADLLIEGSSSIAKRLNISDLVIGLTIVAFGTSAPELIVNVMASYNGNTDLAIANVLGSNIANTFLAIGGAAIFTPLIVKRNTIYKEIPLTLLAAIVLFITANDVFLDGNAPNQITRSEGLTLIGFFIIFFFYTVGIAADSNDVAFEKTKRLTITRSMTYILFGLLGLTYGGEWIVSGSVDVAKVFGMSETLVGITVVAIGTSLPEITTSILSAYKGKSDIAIGNAVGSNIFNIFWVLAASSTIKTLPFSDKINFDVGVNILASLLLFLFLYIANKKHTLKRGHGIFFIALYSIYIGISVMRG